MASAWTAIEDQLPTQGVMVETRREGENGTNLCHVIISPEDDQEWVEELTGATTITHGIFLPPTHWRQYEWLNDINGPHVPAPERAIRREALRRALNTRPPDRASLHARAVIIAETVRQEAAVAQPREGAKP